MMKLILILFLSFIFSSCTLQNQNIKKNNVRVVYYGSLYDIENIGSLKFYTKYSLKNILHIRKDPESSYVKVYYSNNGILIKAEEFQGNNLLPSKTFFINKNNINYKIRRYQGKLYIDCNLTYQKKGIRRIKTIMCSDGTKEILTTETNRIFISYFKYDKNGHVIKKEISTKRGIEMYQNGKLIEIRNEID